MPGRVSTWLVALKIGVPYILAAIVGMAAVHASAPLLDHPVNPLRYENPQPLIGPSAIYPGGSIRVSAVKCNKSDEDVAVSGWADWRSGNVAIPYMEDRPSYIIAANTCITRNFTNKTPTRITAGVWKLVGADCIAPKFEVCADWETEPFVVLEGQ